MQGRSARVQSVSDVPDLWHGPLVLPGDMPVGHALAAMRHSGQRCAFVSSAGVPIAVVTEAELVGAMPTTPVGDRAEWPVLHVPVGAGEEETVRLYDRAAWRWLRRPRAG